MVSNHKKELFLAGYQLAYYIYPDKQQATAVVREALLFLQMSCLRQDKRTYYQPVGRALKSKEFVNNQTEKEKHRYKVILTEEQLFQFLIYHRFNHCLDLNSLDLDGLLIFYIMYLVKEVIKRNSFYTSILNYGLLYNYTRQQTMDFYYVIDPNRFDAKLPHHFDRAKERLTKELENRFEQFKINFAPASRQLIVKIKECLNRFNLWSQPGQPIKCVIPSDFGANKLEIQIFKFDSEIADQEHTTEYQRIHTLLDPDCHNRIMKALGYSESADKLLAANFISSHHGGDMSKSDRNKPPTLTDAELNRELAMIASEEERFRKHPINTLTVKIDGVKSAQLDLKQQVAGQINIKSTAEVIEFWANLETEPALLAVQLLFNEEIVENKTISVKLDDQQELNWQINPITNNNEPDSITEFKINFSYHKTAPATETASQLTFIDKIINFLKELVSTRRAKAELAFALLLVAAVTFSLWQNISLHDQLSKSTNEQQALLQREKELQRQLDNSETGTRSADHGGDIIMSAGQDLIATFNLKPDIDLTSGDNSSLNRLNISPETKVVQLVVYYDSPFYYQSYLTIVQQRNQNLAPVWQSNVTINKQNQQKQRFILNIPAELLKPGEYRLILKGIDQSNVRVDLAAYSFDMIKP